jgi:hypothetical protein
MLKKRGLSSVFLIVILVFTIYAAYASFNIVTITGMAASEETRQLSTNLYDHISLVTNHPRSYIIVLGKYAEIYEEDIARRLAKHFDTRIMYEQDVKTRNRLVIIGSKHTNTLLDKIIQEDLDENKPELIVRGDNLILYGENKAHFNQIVGLIENYRVNRGVLSKERHSFIDEGVDSNIFVLSIIGIVAVFAFIGIIEF